LGAGALALLGFYFLSPMPLAWFLTRMGIKDEGWVGVAFKAFYAPLIWCHHNVGWVRQFYEWCGELLGIR
jgi:hypothetical protein